MSREAEIRRLAQEIHSLREQNKQFAEYIKSSSVSLDAYFAGIILEAILSNSELLPNIESRNWEDLVVRDAWDFADRMIRYRRGYKTDDESLAFSKRHTMSPFEVQFLLHCFSSDSPFQSIPSPAMLDTITRFTKLGLIQKVRGTNSVYTYRTTGKGDTLVARILATPIEEDK